LIINIKVQTKRIIRGLFEPEAFHSFIPTVPPSLSSWDWESDGERTHHYCWAL